MTVFATWADATAENIDAWVAAQPAEPAPYVGMGQAYHESIGRAAARAWAWDGNIIARCNASDWQQMVSGEWRSPHRMGIDGGRRFVDYSDMIPASSRTLHVVADNSIPPGHCVVETPDGRIVARVQF